MVHDIERTYDEYRIRVASRAWGCWGEEEDFTRLRVRYITKKDDTSKIKRKN